MLPEPTRIVELMTTKVSKVPMPWSLRLIALFRRRELWLLVGGALLLAPLLWWLSEPVADLMVQAEELRSWILTFGPLSPLVYIGVFSLQIWSHRYRVSSWGSWAAICLEHSWDCSIALSGWWWVQD